MGVSWKRMCFQQSGFTAHASLDGVTDEYDVPALFPMFSDRMDLHDHYGNALFSRLSSACTSIRNALQSIHSHMDCHAAIAASRRAHESMWQMFLAGQSGSGWKCTHKAIGSSDPAGDPRGASAFGRLGSTRL